MEPTGYYRSSAEVIHLIALHIITSEFPPETGGLERWTFDLATAMAGSEIRVAAYICGEIPVAHYHQNAPFDVIDLAVLRAPWDASLNTTGWPPERVALERSGLVFACLRAEIAKRLASAEHHVILSNFLTGVGFTAHILAEDLGLPHIAVAVGTDFTRGFRNPRERSIITEIVQSAALLVGKSNEQIRGISRRIPNARCELIETSVKAPLPLWRRRSAGEPVRIFSDTGFSYKKGTGVLLDAFSRLRAAGVPAKLELCGEIEPLQQKYWSERKRSMETQFAEHVLFPGYVTRAKIIDGIYESDIYASATLGEGSSAARALALCIGVPLVTTACGELAEDPQVEHVRLVPVGDQSAFYEAMAGLVQQVLSGSLTIDQSAVERFRSRFDPGLEWSTWLALINRVALDA